MDKLICHRGIHNEIIKENTYDSIYLALNSDKYIGVEFDIRITKDKKFILWHDPTYKGKLISNLKLKELPKYVTRLEKVLKIPTNKIFLIEIKNIGNEYNEFIKILEKSKDKNIYVMSFSVSKIKNIDIDSRTYKIGVLNYILNTTEYFKKLDFICILNSFINSFLLEKLKNYEIISYGLVNARKFPNISYIIDD